MDRTIRDRETLAEKRTFQLSHFSIASFRLIGGWILRHLLVISLSFVFAMPLIWALSTSLKTQPQVYVVPPKWVPNPVKWMNYPEALTKVPFLRYMLNTMKIAVPSVLGTVLSNAIVGYGFARIRWRYRNVFFIICISTMMIPYQVTMIPLFITFKNLGWINTYLPLIVPSFFGNAYYIFLFRQFFMTIPQELSDAARVDGCSELLILTRIIVPLSVPALAMVGLFHFLWTWNDYLGPLLYVGREELFTVALGLSKYQAGGWSQANWSYLMAASVTSIVPILVLFFLTQRTFIEGITLTGIKG
jgi:ABC-type glycerol-3-phosphate transport system permease component